MRIRAANINYPWKEFTPRFVNFSNPPQNNGSRCRMNLTSGLVEIEVRLISDSEQSKVKLKAQP